ncbi:MAG: hypothetical protein ACI905_000556 [Roseivirga sp.]|jgi:hypothetical protein
MGLEINNCFIGGGLIFTDYTLEDDCYPYLAQSYFNQVFIYIGYVGIEERYRGLNRGSFWFSEIHKKYPNDGIWLSIMEPSLGALCEKNGFSFDQEIELAHGLEWVYCRKP